MLTLRNCSFIDPSAERLGIAGIARSMGMNRPVSIRQMVARRDHVRVRRCAVCLVTFAGAPHAANINPRWLDWAFAHVSGVASFVRHMSGGRQYLEWQVFGPLELMSIQQKQVLDGKKMPELEAGYRSAAKEKGIPIDDFERVLWILDEPGSDSGTTNTDSLIGAKHFTPNLTEHEIAHTFGICSHADAIKIDDYDNPFCIMGSEGAHGFTIEGLGPGAPIAPETMSPFPPKTGPGMHAAYLTLTGWFDPARNAVQLPRGLAEIWNAEVQLRPNRGAPIPDSDDKIALVVGSTPQQPADPAQSWFELRTPTGFDREIAGDARVPGIVLAHRLERLDVAAPTRCKGALRSTLVDAVPAVVGAMTLETADVCARITAVSPRSGSCSLRLEPAASKAYFFSGNRYLRYDIPGDRVDNGYPLPIAGNWAGLTGTPFAEGFDAGIAFAWDKVYLFKGAQYVRYDILQDRIDPGYPLPIAGNWPGFAEAGFDTGIDACLRLGLGVAYFFKGSQYIRYDAIRDRVEAHHPQPIAGNWPGFAEAGFANGIDGCIRWLGTKAYFFKGSQYLRYDIAAARVEEGPVDIGARWPGFAAAHFDGGIKAPFFARIR